MHSMADSAVTATLVVATILTISFMLILSLIVIVILVITSNSKITNYTISGVDIVLI